MKLISKFRNEILLFLSLSLIYFILRLVYLDKLPIFTDEAIYIRWAQIALHDSSWRFISLTDGKQPMYVWAAMIFLKFVSDPLIAGRLVSVFSGFLTMIGLWFLSHELFKSKKTAFLTTILYIAFPFAVVYDRMALYDSMVATFYVWALYFSVLLVRKLRLEIAYTLGFVIAGGVLTKTNDFFSIYLLPFTLLLFDFKNKLVKKRLLGWILLAGFSSGIAYGLYNILRLSPLFSMISAKNATFVYPISEWINHPFVYFNSNFSGLLSWLLQYLSFFYLIPVIASLIFFKKFPKEKLLLIIYFVLPFLALALFGKLIYPRFIFLMSLMLLPLVALGIEDISNFAQKYIKLSVSAGTFILITTIIVVSYPSLVSFQFITNPVSAKIADQDSSQYLNGWASGWGVKESVNFFKQQSQNKKIFVATEGTFGLMPESMEIYLINNKNITVKGFWPVDIFPKQVLDMANKMPTYFIFYQPQHVILPPTYPQLKLIFKVKQGNTDNFYRVYQVIPNQT